MKQYDVIIGLEIHAELKTKSKMFCACKNNMLGDEPNTAVCPTCMGHPGTLPNPNKQAVEWTALIGMAINASINRVTKFDRKHYYYPDLPKGYQISQYDLPIAYSGYIEVGDDKVAITRVHLEEDTGKLAHPAGKDYSLIDLNRASAPLVEMVTEPTIKSAAQAKRFCQLYQQILRYLKISDADMEKGQMRCEANISLQEKGAWEYKGDGRIYALNGGKLNSKVEVKNINSFRALEKAIEYEIVRQTALLNDEEKIIQETRGWDENQGKTVSQRAKEEAAEYRYFFEPDIPPIEFDDDWLREIKSKLIELPPAKIRRFVDEYNFAQDIAETLASEKDVADYTEEVISELRAWIDANGDDWERQKNKLAKIASNWLTSELFKHLKANNESIADIKITPENFAELIALVYEDKINSSAAQTILTEMYEKGGEPTSIMQNLGLEQVDDEEELIKHVDEVLVQSPTQVEQYKQGKTNLLQFFVGKVMASTQGKSNPKKVLEILTKKLQ